MARRRPRPGRRKLFLVAARGGDVGSASVLGVAVVAATITATAAAAFLGGLYVARAQASAAADAAALAAADVASGLVAGEPCSIASELASRHGTRLEECKVDGLVAEVVASCRWSGLIVEIRARAGPPVAAS